MDVSLGDFNRIIEAVETIMCPSASAAKRLEAHQVCEYIKENLELSIQNGLQLLSTQYSPYVRRFGLQLLEHSIKYKWNEMNDQQKQLLKSSSIEIIAKGMRDILEEEAAIKDAVARIAVEVIKRQWPQMWTSLQKELYDLCQLGPTQTEIVLKIYLRLVEDVVEFQSLPPQRRREVWQGLTTNMGDLMELFIQLLQHHTDQATPGGSNAENDIKSAERHLRVSQTVLATLPGYLDWVHINHVFIHDGLLLQLLCLLLSNQRLQLPAVECLLVIVGRKGKVEERKPLLILFCPIAMGMIWNAAVAAEKSSHNEYYYLFLKRLCQVLVELGRQLCAMWGVVEDVGQPAEFDKYLEALLAFTQYPSQMISSFTLTLWSSFLRHEHISADPILLSFIPRLLQASTTILLKVGFPSQNNSLCCEYSRLDFDGDTEFNLFFAIYRSDIAEILRNAVNIAPDIAFKFTSTWLQNVLEKAINTGNENEMCTLSSPSFVEWDALSLCVEHIMCKVQESQSCTPLGVKCLTEVLNYQTQDPLIMSSLLSCLSALFRFVKHIPDKLPLILEKIFSAVTFNPVGKTKGNRSKAVKNVRQHACSILVKICKQHTDYFFPVFVDLCNHVRTISSDPEELSQMEKCILIEALILVSNKFQNFDKQSSFVEEVIKPVKELWLSNEFNIAFSSAAHFMSYIGLNQAPVEPSSADTCGINRSHISYCIHTMLAVIKRCQWPQDIQVATEGGFVVGKLEDGSYIYRNPATVHICVLIKNLLMLFQTMNSCWSKENLKLRHPAFEKSFDLTEADRANVLGIPPPYVDTSMDTAVKQPRERMQLFLSLTHETCCHILGSAGMYLGYEFYTTADLGMTLLGSVFSHVEHLPDYRLRSIIRCFLKPYTQSCPKEFFSTAIIPVLSFFCPYMYQMLCTKWQKKNERSSQETKDDNMESQEVIEDLLVSLVTKEYVEFLVAILQGKKHVDKEGTDDKPMEEDAVINQSQKEECLSDLGQVCMQTESVYPSIAMFVFQSLSWKDNTLSVRLTSIGFSIIKQLHISGYLNNESANHFFYAVLCGLQLHGEHEAAQYSLILLGLRVYELLRPTYPDLRNILMQIPKCTAAAIETFDDKLLQKNPQKQMTDKKKKDAFKKLVSEIIGKSVGQQFKKETHYKNLPPIFRIRPKNLSLDEIDPEKLGLCDLFTPSNGNDC